MSIETDASTRDWLRGPTTRLLAGGVHRPRSLPVCLSLFGSSSHLDSCARLDGSGLHPEYKAVRPHALPLHRTVLSRHDCAGASVAVGIGSAGFFARLIMGDLILAGSGIIWRATEHSWGKFSS
jgi:hypothetical protein